MDFDFLKYLEEKKKPETGREEKTGFGEYAYSGDVRILRRLDSMKPVRLVAEASVRFWKSVERNELLGTCVEVTRRQFPELYDHILECADTLDIPPPSVYVSESPHLNAGTYGTDDESFIIVQSALIDRFEPEEVKFVIGHECGHIQNNHVVYRTAAHFLTRGVVSAVKWAMVPATMALKAWSRRAEITCDRAGLLCAKNEEVALQSMLKLAVGSKELFDKLDVDEYLNQLDDLQKGVGRFKELFESHPYLPKRVKALKLFRDSSYYKRAVSERDGRPLDEIDEEVKSLLSVL
jgi:Zn-dependent protease with chaperone function